MAINRITINGVTVEVEGSNVNVFAGTIYVDGKAVASGLGGEVHIIWQGSLASLEAGGSVACGDITGDVTAGGSVHAAHVQGHVTAGGSVHVARKSERVVDVGHVAAGGSVHMTGSGRYGRVDAGGSVYLH